MTRLRRYSKSIRAAREQDKRVQLKVIAYQQLALALFDARWVLGKLSEEFEASFAHALNSIWVELGRGGEATVEDWLKRAKAFHNSDVCKSVRALRMHLIAEHKRRR